jgi:hypothetical protein
MSGEAAIKKKQLSIRMRSALQLQPVFPPSNKIATNLCKLSRGEPYSVIAAIGAERGTHVITPCDAVSVGLL